MCVRPQKWCLLALISNPGLTTGPYSAPTQFKKGLSNLLNMLLNTKRKVLSNGLPIQAMITWGNSSRRYLWWISWVHTLVQLLITCFFIFISTACSSSGWNFDIFLRGLIIWFHVIWWRRFMKIFILFFVFSLDFCKNNSSRLTWQAIYFLFLLRLVLEAVTVLDKIKWVPLRLTKSYQWVTTTEADWLLVTSLDAP